MVSKLVIFWLILFMKSITSFGYTILPLWAPFVKSKESSKYTLQWVTTEIFKPQSKKFMLFRFFNVQLWCDYNMKQDIKFSNINKKNLKI